MISKIKEFSKDFRNRLIYELAARTCDREKIKHVEFVGGNLVSDNPYYEFNEDGQRTVFVDPEQIIEEFEQHASNYRGDSEKLCAHYILSLAEGESLTRGAWLDAVHNYMREQGYDESTKYVAVIHRDTKKEHVHIVASRVRLVERDANSARATLGANFQLVSDSNDRHKGMQAARQIEQKYDLSTPRTDGWTKEQKPFSDPEKNHVHLIRGISKDIFKAPNGPRTMSQLVDRFADRGIQIRVVEKDGQVQGISYRLDRPDGRWLTGSTIMATKLTWQALQRNGVSYSSHRDNAKLGVGLGISQPNVTTPVKDVALVRAYVNITKQKKDLSAYVRKRSSKYAFYKDNNDVFLGFNFSVNFRKLQRHEVELEIEKRRQEQLLRSTLKMIEPILGSIFSLFEVRIEPQADVYDLSQTALKIKAPILQSELANIAELEIHEQCLLQLKNISQLCRQNESQILSEEFSPSL